MKRALLLLVVACSQPRISLFLGATDCPNGACGGRDLSCAVNLEIRLLNGQYFPLARGCGAVAPKPGRTVCDHQLDDQLAIESVEGVEQVEVRAYGPGRHSCDDGVDTGPVLFRAIAPYSPAVGGAFLDADCHLNCSLPLVTYGFDVHHFFGDEPVTEAAMLRGAEVGDLFDMEAIVPGALSQDVRYASLAKDDPEVVDAVAGRVRFTTPLLDVSTTSISCPAARVPAAPGSLPTVTCLRPGEPAYLLDVGAQQSLRAAVSGVLDGAEVLVLGTTWSQTAYREVAGVSVSVLPAAEVLYLDYSFATGEFTLLPGATATNAAGVFLLHAPSGFVGEFHAHAEGFSDDVVFMAGAPPGHVGTVLVVFP